MLNIQTLRIFVRVYELENMSAAARDLRVSAAVASARIAELERHLGIRLFTRTTRSIQPTEQGRIFYPKALHVLEAVEEAEAAVHEVTGNPRGSLFVSAPLGFGRRFVAPLVPEFHDAYPGIHVRLRLSDRKVDITAEALDLAFVLGALPDSALKLRMIADCPRLVCAAPDYVARRGLPESGEDLTGGRHDCLLLRYPGSDEFRWTLRTPHGPQNYDIDGPFASDDGDVLTEWALAGRGIVLKPVFEVAEHLASGRLVPVCEATPPEPAQLACLFPHRRNMDPKTRLFMDFMTARFRESLAAALAPLDAQLPR